MLEFSSTIVIFHFFLSFRGFLLRLYLRGGRGLPPYQFLSLDFLNAFRLGLVNVAKSEKEQEIHSRAGLQPPLDKSPQNSRASLFIFHIM